MMDDYFAEAKELLRFLNCDVLSSVPDLVLLMKKFSTENPVKRKQLALRQFLADKDKSVSMNIIQKEAEELKKIFPDHAVQDITQFLLEYGSETNRVKIVTRKLLKENGSDRLLKRVSSNSILREDSVEKKAKIDCPYEKLMLPSTSGMTNNHDVRKYGQEEPAANSSSLDSESTIIYPLENESFLSIKQEPLEDSKVFVEADQGNDVLGCNVVETMVYVKQEPLSDIEADPTTFCEQFEPSNNSISSNNYEPQQLEQERSKNESNSKELVSIFKNEIPIKNELPSMSVPEERYNMPGHSCKNTSNNHRLLRINFKRKTETVASAQELKFLQNKICQLRNICPITGIDIPPMHPYDNKQQPEQIDSSSQSTQSGNHTINAISNPFPITDRLAEDFNLTRRQTHDISKLFHDQDTNSISSDSSDTDEDNDGMIQLKNHGTVKKELLKKSTNGDFLKPILKERGKNGCFDIYEQLHEMFNDISMNKILVICDEHHVDRYDNPPVIVFNALVSALLALRKSDASNDYGSTGTAVANALFSNDEQPSCSRTEYCHDTKRKSKTESTMFSKDSTSKKKHKSTVPVSLGSPGPSILKNRNLNATSVSSTKSDQVIDIVDNEDCKSSDGSGSSTDLDLVENVNKTQDKRDSKPDNTLVSTLMEMFPQACPRFIQKVCSDQGNKPGALDHLISHFLEQDYPLRQKEPSPERKMDAEEQFQLLIQIFPDADPTYLQVHCDQLADKPDELKVFIANLLETRQYPTMKDYLRKQQISAQQKQYTSEFNVENFLEVIPDPFAYFEDGKRKGVIVDDDMNLHYAICFLRNQFCRISMRVIRDIVKKHKFNFLEAYKDLKKVTRRNFLKSKRGLCPMPESSQNIPLLQEIAFIQHREEIKLYIEMKKIRETEEKQAAKEAGLLETCNCCFDEDVMPRDMYKCEADCSFCKNCIRKGCEVAFGKGKLHFDCLGNCSSHYSLQTLQAVLKPKMFSKIALKKQVEEVKAAGIEDLETCPFCDFVTIPAKEDKLFRCLNPECMKESCRSCKEPSHLPLRCEEVEKEDDVKARTYIENKMTEALLRKCYKCNLKFIKSDGCNKMTCSCGAMMCYLCNRPVKDYKHFNGPGGDRLDLCPLYNDTNDMHQRAVLRGAEEAKKEIGLDKDPTKLKIDPTTDVQQHYNAMKKKDNNNFNGLYVMMQNRIQDINIPLIDIDQYEANQANAEQQRRIHPEQGNHRLLHQRPFNHRDARMNPEQYYF